MQKITLLLKQNVGGPAVPQVEVGEHVDRGQLIGKPEGLGAYLHASVSGNVTAITETAIEIAPDAEQPKDFVPIPETDDNLEAIKLAGIVGAGGAGFPTHVKLGTPIKGGHLLINAAECEPVLNHNISRIQTDAEKIIRGIEYVKEIVQAKDVQIAVKRKHVNTVALLEEAIRGHDDISLELLKNRYPEGEERAIIRESNLKTLLKTTDLPSAANAVVSNVETIYRIAQAIEDRQPVITKDITVAGRLQGDNEITAVHKDVPVGISVGAMLDLYPEMADYGELIMGGPFTGKRTDRDEPVTKTTGGIIATIPFPQIKGEKVGLLACACGATPVRMQEMADSMGADVVGMQWCKNAVVNEKTGTAKCINPGICPGQAEKVLNLKKMGAHTLLIGNCTDCTNTVMGIAPKLNMPVYHTTDFARRATGNRIMRHMLPENDQ